MRADRWVHRAADPGPGRADAQEVYQYCRAAALCFVSGLHDGMNRVARECVAARHDAGVLLLGRMLLEVARMCQRGGFVGRVVQPIKFTRMTDRSATPRYRSRAIEGGRVVAG